MTSSPAFFIDTSSLIALHNKRDQNHGKVVDYIENLEVPLKGLTSNLILTEYLTYFSRHGDLKNAISFCREFVRNQDIKVVWVTSAIHEKALRILEKFLDQKLSMTDAVSFSMMREEGLQTALAFDSDFTKAGFQIVP